MLNIIKKSNRTYFTGTARTETIFNPFYLQQNDLKQTSYCMVKNSEVILKLSMALFKSHNHMIIYNHLYCKFAFDSEIEIMY